VVQRLGPVTGKAAPCSKKLQIVDGTGINPVHNSDGSKDRKRIHAERTGYTREASMSQEHLCRPTLDALIAFQEALRQDSATTVDLKNSGGV
jgi:hypothetical protein